MDRVIERLKTEFSSEDARYAYADSVTSAFVTGQIKALREARNLTQEQLAELVGTQQSGISRWQNSGYSSCKVETLRKFARALGVRLRISFEEFGSLPDDITGFSKERLAPRRFEDDPVFKDQVEESEEIAVADTPPAPALAGLSYYSSAKIQARMDWHAEIQEKANRELLNYLSGTGRLSDNTSLLTGLQRPLEAMGSTSTPLSNSAASPGLPSRYKGIQMVPKIPADSIPAVNPSVKDAAA